MGDDALATRHGAGYPRRAWSAYHYSIVVLGEFVRASIKPPGQPRIRWHRIALPAVPDDNKTKDELKELVALIEYRSGVMAEAMAQRSNFLGYWQGVLTFNASSHPWTCDLCEIALRVGQFQAMHYKNVFNRPRPSQLLMALMPPIDPPGHAAYPSGHATEAYIISAMLKEVMPAGAAEPLDRLAERVARNREVLGMHYPSDSEAGKVLALASKDLLMKCASVRAILPKARTEW